MTSQIGFSCLALIVIVSPNISWTNDWEKEGGKVGKGKNYETTCIPRKPRKCIDVRGRIKVPSAKCGPTPQFECWGIGDMKPDNKSRIRAK